MTESDKASSAVKLHHVVEFGGIVHICARFEAIMVEIVANLLGLRSIHALVLMNGLGYAGKRAALYSLLEHHPLPQRQKDGIKSFLDQAHAHNTLRNNVAHNNWGKGRRPDSIRPVTVVVRGGTGKLIGFDDKSADYTPAELARAADHLTETYNRFLDFLDAEDLLPPIALKTDKSRRSTSRSPGKPSSKKRQRTIQSSKAVRPATKSGAD